MLAVFINFSGLYGGKEIRYKVCKGRNEAESFVSKYGWKYNDSFVMSKQEFKESFGVEV